jgi:hypothetical protein
VRTKAVVVLVLTLVSSVLDAQQHALPAVTPRTVSADASTLPPATFDRTEPIVYLDALPLRDDSGQLTITEAARNNDYRSFETLYTNAKARGEQVGQFDALHELWSWSMNSATGAFYGPDLHARFAAAYPGFADYIADYKIVDSRGNVFYPTAETRQFLLDHAVRGTRTPRVDVARYERGSSGSSVPRSSSGIETRGVPGTSEEPRNSEELRGTSSGSLPRGGTQSRARMQKSEATTYVPGLSKPAVIPAPVQVVAVTKSAPVAVAAPALAPPVAQPVLASMVSPKPVVPVVKPATQGAWGRGVLLLIIGIAGLGVLTAILRAPKEQPLSIMSAEGTKAADNVEPIRKPETAPQQQSNGKKSSATRANGSR